MLIEKRISLSRGFEYVKVGDLKPYLEKIHLKVKIVEMGKTREVSGGQHRVSEALVGDESGCIYLSLWDDSIDGFEVGDTVHVENGQVPVYRESMRLSAGRYGTVSKIDEEFSDEVNTDNNLSDRRVEQRQRRPRSSLSGLGRGAQSPRSNGDHRRRRYWYQRR